MSNGPKSQLWRVTVGLGAVVAVVALTVYIVVWQTNKKDGEVLVSRLEPPSSSVLGTFENAAISCDAPYCAEIGKEMLEKGGSVADAAIAALLCMGVVHSQSSGIGGGFLMVMYNATTKSTQVLNAREVAPKAAEKHMYAGNAALSQRGALSVAVPGEIKGYWELHKVAGKLPWSDLFQPSIKLARYGFKVSRALSRALNASQDGIMAQPTMREVFVDNTTGESFKLNDVVKRHVLANTLERIANSKIGGDELYVGDLSKEFVEDLEAMGGIITTADLENYKAVWSTPIQVDVSGNFTLHTVPPPGSGVLLAFIMKVLSIFKSKAETFNRPRESIKLYQRIIETFKHAYAKRTVLGDPWDEDVKPFVDELVRNLTSDEVTHAVRNLIDDDSTNNTYEYYGAEFYQPEDHGTAHVSIIAPNGDAIAITSTVNLYFGAQIRSKRTGIIYNDEMDDFSAPDITNYFGVRPSPHNFITPGKRPLSSMSPAIFTDSQGRVRLTLGSAGGTKITTATSLVAMRYLWFNENIKEAIDARRIHHQLYPMQLAYEDGFIPEYVAALEKIGHKTKKFLSIASTCAVSRGDNGTIYASFDFRKGGTIAGY